MLDSAEIVEVGPRDGLQSEPHFVPTADKIRLIELLSSCGLKTIEVASFVSRNWVPQMADAAEVLRGIRRARGVTYVALTPNLRGYEDARAATVDEVAIFASASEGFSQHNINCSIAESLERFAPVLAAARSDAIPVRGYVSCITDCPYDGPVSPDSVARVAGLLLKGGCRQISLGDTIGSATPETVATMLKRVLEDVDAPHLAGHFHDTRGLALENIVVCLEHGLRTFDASAGGLGGCPYAPGAGGNVATGAVAGLLEKHGLATGIDRARLAEAEQFARKLKEGA